MKFGYMLDFRNPASGGMDFGTFYAEMFRQVEFVDQVGFDSIWLTEHHFTDDGYLAAQMPTLAAIAARTRRVTLGTYVLLAPFYHPLRLAEDSATIDVISGGRLRLGIGLGYRAEEFEGFQVARGERLGRTLETIEILRRAWTGERFSFTGKYFNFTDARVLPRPVSQPYPELLWGGMARKAIERGARMGLSFACNLGRREVQLYRETLVKCGKDPAAFSIVGNRLVYVADSFEQAWADIEGPAIYQAALYAKWLSAAASPDQKWFLPDPERLKQGAVIGSPENVRQRLAELFDAGETTEIILAMQLPGLAPAKTMRSLERFASEVLPRLRR
ncbi:MAG TPA: LLM class flavin-dependent oxidoreductase [Candidatus Binataceae bacterium]|nr:LLM class flavin-dependent oxidoreductase [Candidatus Binataceae bacterium]